VPTIAAELADRSGPYSWRKTIVHHACLAALALALTVALPQGDKDKPKKPAAPGAAAQAPAKTPTTLAAIQSAHDEMATKAHKDVQEKRLAAIEAHLKKARVQAEKYLAEFKEGEQAGSMQLLRARCLANEPGKAAAAKEAFEAALEAAGDNVQLGVAVGTELAGHLTETGDVAGAKKTLEDLSVRYQKARGLKEYLQVMKDDLEAIGTEPKPIDVTGLDGKPLSLAGLKGKVVLLDFWATWCGPCMQELPNVLAAYRKYHDKGFEIVGISLDQDEKKLRACLTGKGMTWPQFFDGKGWQNAVAVDYGIQSIPATFLLDKDGKVVRKGLRGPALERAIEKLLGTKKS
jgi:thiol-disulfide isomerase/thioredoxin